MSGRNEELVQLYQEGNKQALDELLEKNRGVICKLANKYLRAAKEHEFDDLFNSGVIGFINAAKRYDFNNEKKASFITYAVHYINRYIYDCVNGRSDKEIENNKLYNSTISLYTPIGNEEDVELLDTIEDVDYSFENIDYQILLKQLRNELEEVMKDKLTLKQREVIQFRYGWNTEPMTLKEIGDILGHTRERIRQIEAKTLRDIRKTPWGMTKGKEYVKEIFGTNELSYSSIEKRIDFIDRYFKDVV